MILVKPARVAARDDEPTWVAGWRGSPEGVDTLIGLTLLSRFSAAVIQNTLDEIPSVVIRDWHHESPNSADADSKEVNPESKISSQRDQQGSPHTRDWSPWCPPTSRSTAWCPWDWQLKMRLPSIGNTAASLPHNANLLKAFSSSAG